MRTTGVTTHTQLSGVTSDQHHAQLHAADHNAGGGDPVTDIPARATQAAMEAETDQASYVSPDRVQFSPGVAKGRARINTAGGLVEGENVDSVTDTGVGDRTIVWTDDFSNANYCVVGAFAEAPGLSADPHLYYASFAVGSVRHVVASAATLQDVASSSVAHGDR